MWRHSLTASLEFIKAVSIDQIKLTSIVGKAFIVACYLLDLLSLSFSSQYMISAGEFDQKSYKILLFPERNLHNHSGIWEMIFQDMENNLVYRDIHILEE